RADGRVFFAGYYGASGPGVSLPSPTVVFALLAGDLTPDPFAFNAVFGAPRATEIFSNAITVGGLGAASPITVTGGAYSVNGGDFTSAPGFVVNGDTVRARVLSSAAYETVASATVTIGGAVGASATFFAYTRRDPALPATIPAVALGEAHSAYLNSQGLVFAFGRNANGQLGNGSTISSSRPTAVPGVAGVTALAAGANHALVARSDGTVLAWGFNASGQLGDGTTQSRTSAVAPAGLGFVKAVAAGRHHSLALTPGGAVFAWGLNDDGQVGDGTAAATRTTPVAVAGLASGVKAIAAGGRHSLALRDDGTVLAWGANEAGQVGDGTTAQRRSPTLVTGLAGVVAIAAGDSHSLALKADGTLWAWGANGFGQLGLGDNANRPVPTAVAALGGGVGLVAAGEFHTLAVKAGGALFAWGRNANSQLGDGANADRSLPVAVASPAGVVAIAAGGRHSAALDAERRLFVYGDNFFGQVGNRSGNYNPQSGALDTLRGDAVISSGTGGTGTGVGTGGSSGSSVIAIDGQAAAFDFGSRVAGGTSTVSGTLRNASIDTPITGISIEVTGAAYAKLADDCTATGVLPPDQQCGFTLAFTPAGPGPFEGEVLVNSSVIGSPERRALFGTGTAPASPAIAFAKAGVDFAPRFVGTAGTATHQLFNTGNAPLAVGAVTSSTGDFSATHACASVAPGAACEITVTFQPAAVGARAAVLTVASNADGGPHLVTVSGTGVAPPPVSYTLAVARYGSGAGSVSSSPAGIDCGATCQASYLQGTGVTLTATPVAGSRFTGWTGACAGAGPCVVAMNAAASVTAVFAREVRRGDVNADGRADLFWRESGGGAGLSWWTMNGAGLTGYGYFEVPAEWQVADVGDLDGDGRMDLVWQRAADGATYLWRLDGLAPVGFHDLGILPPAEWALVGAADLDGDGRADLVWRHKATGMVYGWLMNGAAIVAQGVVAQVGLDWAIADLADFDGDGRADILWRRVADGATAVWFLDGLAPTGGGTIATVDPAQWLLVGAADFSGDGKADLLWRSVAGDVVVWVLDGGAFAASGYLGNPGIAWSVRALGDLDGDGRADIVWRHADGTMYLWRMNGTAAIAFEPMANPGGSWEIVAP
ncbi:MAG TPA: FG-GAP-like repeat-containing protein, partial [Usitatibacteraceae bacterium]|nr:FG-GAP-like repeat-containing protein [Usitatibacteraceae bacterium]